MSQTIEVLESRRLLADLLPGFFETPASGPVAFGSSLEIAPDGMLFVLEQPGRMQVYENYASSTPSLLQQDFFRDAPPPVNFNDERGLLGIAFDPGYATNRYVYVHYVSDEAPFPNRISRFTANAAGDLALPGSEVVLLETEPGITFSHNGGGIHFGADGKLYVPLGDNGNPSNAQSLTTLRGKILRMNTTPGDIIPDDNPATIDGIEGTTSGIYRLIWAAGLRNPFTSAFQPGTGRFFVNDVGQSTWEEINEAGPGRNFGWPVTEGDFDPADFPDFTRPFFAYSHGTGPGPVYGAAVVGGAFYNPDTMMFPADYEGDYFFGDFSSGWIRRIDAQTKEVNDFAFALPLLSDLRIAPDGSLLYITYHQSNGRVLRVQYAPGAPAVNSSFFLFETAPHRLRFTFSDDVSASLGADDIVLENLTTSTTIPSSDLSLSYDTSTNIATFSYTGNAGGFSDVLPDGRYRATILASGVTNSAGTSLPADYSFEFFFLNGDANRDGIVNLSDFNILSSNFGQSPRVFSEGDFNYDGVVNLADFNLLAARFGTALSPQSTGASGSGAASAGSRLIDTLRDDVLA